MSDLAVRGVAAAKWSTITTLGRFSLQLIAQVTLARLLGPDIYGVFGIGLVVFTFSYFIASFGLSWSLAQLKTISDEDIRFALTWQLIIGLVTGICLFSAAPLVVEYFHEPRVRSIVQWMALACVINAASSVTSNLMRRDMSFRANGMIQFGSYAVGYLIVGIPLAFLGAGVNALVAAWMVQALVVAVASYKIKPHPIKPLLVGPQAREMLEIGTTVFFTNLGNWFINNLDRMLIGRFLNAHSMGLYTVGYNLANMPSTLLINALQPVFLAAGAQVQHEPDRLRNAYRQVCATILVLLLPFFVILAVMAPDMIALLYGPAWSETAPVLAVLFLSMPAFITWGMSTPVLWNTGRARYEVLLQLPLLLVAAVVFYLFGRDSVLMAATIASGVLVARGQVMAIAASRALKIEFSAWLGWMARGLFISAALATLVLGARQLAPTDWLPLVRLVIEAVVALAGAGALLVIWPRLLGNEATQMLVRFVPPLRGRLSVSTSK